MQTQSLSLSLLHTLKYIHTFMYICTYIYTLNLSVSLSHTHTHTHTNIYIYIYIYTHICNAAAVFTTLYFLSNLQTGQIIWCVCYRQAFPA